MEICKIEEEDKPFFICELEYMGFPKCLEIKPSKIHGIGIFSNCDIESDKVISLYGCSGVQLKNSKGIIFYKNHNKYLELFDLDDYKINTSGKKINSIYGNPFLYNENMMGHLINDSFTNVKYFENLNDNNVVLHEFGKKYVEYMLNSVKNDNCVLVQKETYAFVKTIKPIKKGDELFASYDIPYWCKNLSLSNVIELINSYTKSLSPKQQIFMGNLYKNLLSKRQ